MSNPPVTTLKVSKLSGIRKLSKIPSPKANRESFVNQMASREGGGNFDELEKIAELANCEETPKQVKNPPPPPEAAEKDKVLDNNGSDDESVTDLLWDENESNLEVPKKITGGPVFHTADTFL